MYPCNVLYDVDVLWLSSLFTQYNMNDAGKYATVSNLLSMTQIIGLFLTPFIMKFVSKKNLFMIGAGISVVGFAITGLTTNYTIICAMSVVKGLGFACAGATMFGLLQDAITYGEWYNGYGTAGMGNAASSFCMKVGSGIGTAALGWILAVGNYNGTAAVQPDSAIFAIKSLFLYLPLAITVVVLIIWYLFMGIDKVYPTVRKELDERRKNAKQN